MDNFSLAEMFKVLSDENRIKILRLLSEREMNAGQLLSELDVTQPTLSHHMKLLCDSGLLLPRKEGKWTYYSLSADRAEELAAELKAILNTDGAEGQTHLHIESKGSLPSHLL